MLDQREQRPAGLNDHVGESTLLENLAQTVLRPAPEVRWLFVKRLSERNRDQSDTAWNENAVDLSQKATSVDNMLRDLEDCSPLI